MLEELYEENIEKLLELVQCTCINMINKDFLNVFKLINIIRGGLKEELDFVQNRYSPIQTLTFFTMIEWILELVREMTDYIGI